MRNCLLVLAIAGGGLAAAAILGCSGYEPALPQERPATTNDQQSTAATPAPTAAAPTPAPTAPAAPSAGAQALAPGAFIDLGSPGSASRKSAQPAATAPSPAPPTANAATGERVKAEAGVGKQGRGYGGGIISEPIRVKFFAEQRIIFNNVQHALDLYRAEHDRLPKSHEAFMKDIIEANSIKLPELPPGERYQYDVKAGELMVERPSPDAPAAATKESPTKP